MLVKLAFVMQRLKNYLKKFLSSSTKIGGALQSDFMGGHRAHGGPPSLPTRENPEWSWIKFLGNDINEDIYQPLMGHKSIVYSDQ